MRECDCPEYVSRCAHDGELRVWLVTRTDSRREFQRRTGLELVRGDPVQCPGCGTMLGTVDGQWWTIAGPGVMEEPRCFCAIGITLLASGHRFDAIGMLRGYPSQFYKKNEADALAAFEQAVERMHALVDGDDR